MSDDSLSVHVFGSILVVADGCRLGPRDFGGVKPKQILEILLAARGRPVTKSRIADLLWGESLPRNVSGTLETYVSVLRRRLASARPDPEPLVVTEPSAYRFATERAFLDIDDFDRFIRCARDSELREARTCLDQALQLVRGDVLEDEPYSEWAQQLADQYRDLVIQTHLHAAEAALCERDYRASLSHADSAIAGDPLNERAYRVAMLSHYAMGHQHDALRTFDKCRSMLAEELGIDPLAETHVVHSAILRQEDVESLLPQAGHPHAAKVTGMSTTRANESAGGAENAAGDQTSLDAGEGGTERPVSLESMLRDQAPIAVSLNESQAAVVEDFARKIPHDLDDLRDALQEMYERGFVSAEGSKLVAFLELVDKEVTPVPDLRSARMAQAFEVAGESSGSPQPRNGRLIDLTGNEVDQGVS
jgi:DNA-binding SARP family transcriptional activator